LFKNQIFVSLLITFWHYTYLIGGVVLIGGQSGKTILDTLYELTSISGTWTEIDSKLKIPRRTFAAWPILSRLLSDCSLGEIFFYNIFCCSFISLTFETNSNF
jgi:hypothetical protein